MDPRVKDSLAREALERSVASGPYGWRVTTCPFCADLHQNSKKHCFGLLPRENRYHCLRCREKGTFDPPLLDATLPQAPPPPTQKLYPPPDGYAPFNPNDAWTRWPYEYVLSRGVRPETIEALKIGYCNEGKYRQRIIVPIHNVTRTHWRGFVARALPGTWGAKNTPYRNPSGMPRETLIFNFQAATEFSEIPLLLTEGVFDALPYYPHASAFLGKPTDLQIAKLGEALLASGRPALCLLDGDAWVLSQILCWKLRLLGVRAEFLRFPPGLDPGAAKKEWVWAEMRGIFRKSGINTSD